MHRAPPPVAKRTEEQRTCQHAGTESRQANAVVHNRPLVTRGSATSSAMSSDSPTDPRPITEARLLAMVNASGDSFWEMDAQRRFVYISDNMCRTMGYPREELRGRPVLEFMTPEYRAEIVRLAAARAGEDNPLAHTGPLRHEGE